MLISKTDFLDEVANIPTSLVEMAIIDKGIEFPISLDTAESLVVSISNINKGIYPSVYTESDKAIESMLFEQPEENYSSWVAEEQTNHDMRKRIFKDIPEGSVCHVYGWDYDDKAEERFVSYEDAKSLARLWYHCYEVTVEAVSQEEIKEEIARLQELLS